MDMNTLLPIIIQIVTGIIGGQAVGAAIKQAAMGQLPKILGGAIGGVGGGGDPWQPARRRRDSCAAWRHGGMGALCSEHQSAAPAAARS